MATGPTDWPGLGTWRARDWREVRSIWSALRPELGDPASVGEVVRTFRGRILTGIDVGPVFERWVLEAFRRSGAGVHDPFVFPMPHNEQVKEQIDGLILHGPRAYLVESKFWAERVDFTPIAKLHLQVEQRPIGTLGLFFSAFGYTDPAIELAGALRPTRVLLFDHVDLQWAMGPRRTMLDMVERSWISAVKFGTPYFKRGDETA